MICCFWSARCLGIGYFSGLVSWYYTVLASDYVTIEEALSGPVVARDWRAQKDVNSALQKSSRVEVLLRLLIF